MLWYVLHYIIYLKQDNRYKILPIVTVPKKGYNYYPPTTFINLSPRNNFAFVSRRQSSNRQTTNDSYGTFGYYKSPDKTSFQWRYKERVHYRLIVKFCGLLGSCFFNQEWNQHSSWITGNNNHQTLVDNKPGNTTKQRKQWLSEGPSLRPRPLLRIWVWNQRTSSLPEHLHWNSSRFISFMRTAILWDYKYHNNSHLLLYSGSLLQWIKQTLTRLQIHGYITFHRWYSDLFLILRHWYPHKKATQYLLHNWG